MTQTVIVGAGISGLATAWFLRRRGHTVTVLEAQSEVGGNLRTRRVGDYLIDTGPTSTLLRNGALGDLISAVGLNDELVVADPAAARRYIVKAGTLVPLPTGPLSFITTALFSAQAKLRMLLEPVHARARGEETVAQFVRRRLGPEFLDWAIDPFISGVYAGDPDRLSVRAATARVHALEAQYRSLIIGAAARWLRGRATGPAPTGRLISFRRGMQALPQALAASLGTAVRTQSEVEAMTPQPDGGWSVQLENEELFADRLILSLPAHRAAQLLSPVHPELADSLRGIDYAPVASVALGFARDHIGRALDGFGLLIPSRIARQTLGTLFSSTLFPGRAPPSHVLLTAFIGGARNRDAIEKSDTQLIAQVVDDLRDLLDLRGDPDTTCVTRWRHAIPQYALGHLERLRHIEALAARFPRLHFRAKWRGGISVADCVVNASAFAARLRGP